ncbi:hypothetical protein WDU94_000963 [Cyamophila willieti]
MALKNRQFFSKIKKKRNFPPKIAKISGTVALIKKLVRVCFTLNRIINILYSHTFFVSLTVIKRPAGRTGRPIFFKSFVLRPLPTSNFHLKFQVSSSYRSRDILITDRHTNHWPKPTFLVS